MVIPSHIDTVYLLSRNTTRYHLMTWQMSLEISYVARRYTGFGYHF